MHAYTPTTPLVILAGGRATRLGNLSDGLPKFLMPVGDHERFADLQLTWARAQGFRRVILSVGYRAEQIREYCGDGSKWGVALAYALDGDEPLGTGGAIRKALPNPPEWVATLYGDTILRLDCDAAIKRAHEGGWVAVMTVLKDPPAGHVCNATIDGGKVVYSKKQPSPSWRHIDYGFLVLSKQFIETMPPKLPLDLAEPLEAASKAGRVAAFETYERFWEINTPESLEEFRKRFGNG